MRITVTRPLPGREAQREMAPENRVFNAPEHAVDAAVLALLTPAPAGRRCEDLLGWRVLLIRRNVYPGVHSGQISLPGGKREDEDASLWDAACREAREEVGVPRENIRGVSPLSPLYVEASNYRIHPFAAVHTAESALRADPREVADFKNIPLGVFDPAVANSMRFTDRDGRDRTAPVWHYEGYAVWGATAMILAELYRLAATRGLVCDV